MPEVARVSLAQQIEEVQFHLNSVRRSRDATSTASGRLHVARLEATLETLRMIRRFEGDVRAVIRHGLERERAAHGEVAVHKESAAHGVGGAAVRKESAAS